MQWLLCHQLPQRLLKLRRHRERFIGLDVQRIEDHFPNGPFGVITPGPHDPVADRSRVRFGLPTVDQSLQLRPAWIVPDGIGIERPGQQLLPASQENRPVVELDLQ